MLSLLWTVLTVIFALIVASFVIPLVLALVVALFQLVMAPFRPRPVPVELSRDDVQRILDEALKGAEAGEYPRSADWDAFLGAEFTDSDLVIIQYRCAPYDCPEDEMPEAGEVPFGLIDALKAGLKDLRSTPDAEASTRGSRT